MTRKEYMIKAANGRFTGWCGGLVDAPLDAQRYGSAKSAKRALTAREYNRPGHYHYKDLQPFTIVEVSVSIEVWT